MRSREKRILVFVRRTVGLFGNRCVTSPHALTGGFGAGSGDESVKGTAAAIRLPPEEPDNGRNRSLDHLMARGEGRGRAREQVEAPFLRGRWSRKRNKVYEWTVKFPTSFPFPPAAFLSSEKPTFLNCISRVSGTKWIVYTVRGLSCQNLPGYLYNSYLKFSYLYSDDH